MTAPWNRREFLKSGAALPAMLASPSRAFRQERSGRLPNIVFLMADDLGYGDLGCYGSPDILTPAIDRLARQGVRFTQYYANAPECTPTRTALLTGRYQQRVGGLECAIGIGNVGRYDDAIRLAEQHDLGLPSSEMTISRLLKQAGYSTAVIGKWHLGYEAKFNPLHHGFDYFFGPLGGAMDYFHHTEPDGKSQLYLNREPVKRDGYLTDLITEESVRFIQQREKNEPFFLYVPYTAPHAPYQDSTDVHEKPLGENEWNQGSRETYIKMVERMDWSVGRILEALDKQGFSENTLVIFCSDNGGAKYADNGPLARGKGTVFEGGIRVPCIIRWPGRITQSNRTDRVAVTMDLTASMVRIAGMQSAAGRPFDGVDIIGDIEQDRAILKRTLYWRKRRGDQTWRAVRDGSMKYICDQRGEKKTEYLFDLSVDPEEKINLIESRKGAAGNLRSMLRAWERDVKSTR